MFSSKETNQINEMFNLFANNAIQNKYIFIVMNCICCKYLDNNF